MAEEIITIFRAETSDLDARMNAAADAVEGYDKATEKAKKSTDALGASLGSARAKVEGHRSVMEALGKASDTAASGATTVGAAVSGMAKSVQGAAEGGQSLAQTLLSMGDKGKAAFDAMNLSADETISLLKDLVAEASKTPEGAAALATDLSAAQQEAVGLLVQMGAITVEESKILEGGIKLQNTFGGLNASATDANAATTGLSEQLRSIPKISEEVPRSITQIKQELREAQSQAAQAGFGTKEFIEASERAGQLTDELQTVREAIAQQTGEPLQRVNAQLQGMVSSLFSLDFKKASRQFTTLNETVKQVSFKTIGKDAVEFGKNVGGSVTNAFKTLGRAIMANPILLLAGVLVAAGVALVALREKIAPVRALFDALGSGVDWVVQKFKDFTDLVGLTSFAEEAAAEKAQKAYDKKTAAVERMAKVQTERLQAMKAGQEALAKVELDAARETLKATQDVVDAEAKRLKSIEERIRSGRELSSDEQEFYDQAIAHRDALTDADTRMIKAEAAAVDARNAAVTQGLKLEDRLAIATAKTGKERYAAQRQVIEHDREIAVTRVKQEGGSAKEIEVINAEANAKLRELNAQRAADSKATTDKIIEDRKRLVKELATPIEQERITARDTRDDRVKAAHGDKALLLRIEEQYQQDLVAIDVRYNNQRAALAGQALAIVAEAEGEVRDTTISAAQKTEEELEKSYQDRLKALRDLYDQMRALAPPEQRSLLDERQAKAKEKLEKANEDRRAAIRAAALADIEARYKDETQAKVDAINEQARIDSEETIRLTEEGEHRTELLVAIEKERTERIQEINEEAAREKLRVMAGYASDAAGVIGDFASFISMISAEQQKETDAEVAAIDARIEAAKKEGKDTAKLEEEKANAVERGQRRQAAATRAAAIVTAFSNIASFISKAIAAAATTPGPAVVPAIAAALAAALSAAASVYQAIKQVPQYYTGGVIKHEDGTPARGSHGDNRLIMAGTGEMILNKKQQMEAERIFGRGVWGEIGVPGFSGSSDWSRSLARMSAMQDGGGLISGVSGGVSVTAKLNDRRIVGALGGVGSASEQRRQTELLERIASNRSRRLNPRL